MVECPVCGATFKSLMSHVKYKHGITTLDFKAQYPDSPMVSAETRTATSSSCVESGCGSWRKGMRDSEQGRQNKSRAMTGQKNPFFGRKHSEHTRQKMSDNHADFKGGNNPLTKAVAADLYLHLRLSDRSKAWWADLRRDPARVQAFTAKRSISMAAAHVEGRLRGYGRGHQQGWVEHPVSGQRLYYRSSYERRFIEWCFNNQRDVRACLHLVPYVDENGVTRQYVPDFLVGNIMIEVKPEALRTRFRNPLKEAAGTAFCQNLGLVYLVVTERMLRNLGSVFPPPA